MISAEQIKSLLDLKPHPEGGYFRESYRSPRDIRKGRYEAGHSLATAIYYLLTVESFSVMHRLKADEVFHLGKVSKQPPKYERMVAWDEQRNARDAVTVGVG